MKRHENGKYDVGRDDFVYAYINFEVEHFRGELLFRMKGLVNLVTQTLFSVTRKLLGLVERHKSSKGC